jgi:fimbrial isopeptide formation D2 family protein/LPXTG-motif cell wall-anchored protein
MSTIGKKSWPARVAAAAGAVAITLAGFAGATISAQADPVTGVGNINPETPTSLTINKYAGLQGEPGDGTQQKIDTSTHKPLQGVHFSIVRVSEKAGTAIDLDTQAGWDLINGVTAEQVTASGQTTYTLDDANAKNVVTDANGQATATLDHGLYLVTETGDTGNNNISSTVAPFLVTLPLPTGSGNWLYDVNVYPKNQVLGAPEKKINDSSDQTGLKIGDTVQYTITQTVPALNSGEIYKDASVYDVLPSDGSLVYVATASVKLGGTVLQEGTDYTIDPSGVRWTLTATGLSKLSAGQTLEIVFTAKVTAVTQTGDIRNPGGNGTNPGYGSTFNGTTVPGTPTPYTYWGQLKVVKQDESKNPLKDAEFTIFPKTAASCPADMPDTGLVATGTSGADGVVNWNYTDPASSPLGLFVANSNDGPLSNPTKDYCLYETKAPAGYIAAEVQSVTIAAGSENMLTVPVTDVQQNHPKLPLTGAAGTLLVTGIGVALIALGTGLYMFARRRSNTK